MLTISRYVIHEVHKEPKKTQVLIEFSEKIATIDSFAQKLVEDTHKSFGSTSSLKNTTFEEGHSTTFHTSLLKYLEEERDENFYNHTTNSLNDLKIRIEKEQFATGGYYLFADYISDNRRYICAVLLRKREGLNFRKINNIIRPVDGESLNIEKIAMGFRLNHQIYISDDSEKKYLALVTNQNEVLSGYFKEWVQAAGIISNDTNTSSLIKILKSIDIPGDEKGKSKYDSREEMTKAFYDIIEEGPDKAVNLLNLAEHFYGAENRTRILDYAKQYQITIDAEFKRSPSILKRLITIRAKIKGIELNVDYDKLNANEVDVKDNKIIIRSQALVDQIKNQQNEQ